MNITTKPQDSDGWGKVGRVLCLVAAAVCLIASLYLALTDKVAAGTLVAGLFVVLVLFYYLPQLESFKAYGIEAKLRERVHEAEAILGKLRGTAFAQARLTYHTLGWGSRMGDPGARYKQALADQADRVLRELGASERELADLRKDYLEFARFDLYSTFSAIVAMAASDQQRAWHREMTTLPEDGSEHRALAVRRNRVLTIRARPDPLRELRSVPLKNLIDELVPSGAFSPENERVLRQFGERVVALASMLPEKGRVPDEVADLIDCHSNEARKNLFEQLFGRAPGS